MLHEATPPAVLPGIAEQPHEEKELKTAPRYRLRAAFAGWVLKSCFFLRSTESRRLVTTPRAHPMYSGFDRVARQATPRRVGGRQLEVDHPSAVERSLHLGHALRELHQGSSGVPQLARSTDPI